jgi:ribosomal protein S18 acetylase RimI-like enzyme
MEKIKYQINKSSYNDVYDHLIACDVYFVPRLSEKIAIDTYSKKIIDNAIRIEAWKNNVLVGLIAFYSNKENSFAYITNVSVLNEFNGIGVAKKLMQETIYEVQKIKYKTIRLEVNKSNSKAIDLYRLLDFEIYEENQDNYLMGKIL